MELKFSMELEIRPIRGSGTILYSQEREDGLGDYLSLVLVEGVVEFRYNLGGGPVTIRSVQPISLGDWHRIVAKR
jgi:coxsackievirus/adenovirus receptor